MTIIGATNNVISVLDYVSYERVFTPAEVYTWFATPFTTIPAQGAKTVIWVLDSLISKDYQTTQYTGGGNIQSIYLGSSPNVPTSGTMSAANVNSAIDALTRSGIQLTNTNGLLNIVNKPVAVRNITSAFATGDSPIRIAYTYMVIDLTGLI
jgi:hypothetical protein